MSLRKIVPYAIVAVYAIIGAAGVRADNGNHYGWEKGRHNPHRPPAAPFYQPPGSIDSQVQQLDNGNHNGWNNPRNPHYPPAAPFYQPPGSIDSQVEQSDNGNHNGWNQPRNPHYPPDPGY